MIPQYSNLRILAPTPEYMLAMKVMSSRSTGGINRGDGADIAFLIGMLGLRKRDDVLAILSRYYPDSHVPPRAAYLVDEIIEDIWRV